MLSKWKTTADCSTWSAGLKIAAMHLSLAAAETMSIADGIAIQLKPKGVFAKKSFKKGALKLVPASSKIVQATGKLPIGAVVVQNISIYPQTTTDKDGVVIPAWFICYTCDQALANMEIKFMKAETTTVCGKGNCASNFLVPVFVNKVDIEPGAELLMLHDEPEGQKESMKRKLGAVALDVRKQQKVE